jgi:hypothetical protein
VFVCLFIYFGGAEFLTQGLDFDRQALYHLSAFPGFFALVILETESHFLPGLA